MYSIHSWLRYAVFLLGMAAFGYAVAGLLGKRPYQKRMWDLASSYTFSLYLQIVIGFFLIFATTNRFLDRYLGLHMILSALAVVVAHLTYSTNRRRPREERSYTTHVWGVGLSLVLVVAGILAIRTSVFG
jgi:cytochrome bd-type quinol oxidase subunit 2